MKVRYWVLMVFCLLFVLCLLWKTNASSKAPPSRSDDKLGQVETAGGRTSVFRKAATAPHFDDAFLLRSEIDDLRRELDQTRALQAQKCLARFSAGCPFLSPSSAELRAMARCGIVHFDMPDLSQVQSAGSANEAEMRAIREVNQATERNLTAELRRIAEEMRLPPNPSATVDDLVAAIEGALPTVESDAIFKQIAQQRAGLSPRPVEEGGSPAQRFWRLRSNVGANYENDLALRIGADRAKQLHEEHDGWPLRSVYGDCASANAKDAL
jgi:hypothetical protein